MKFYKSLKQYLNYLLVERGFSEGTIKEYEKDLTLLAEFIQNNYDIDNLEVSDITYYNITEFLADLIIERDCKAVTRNKRLYVIRSYMKYLVKKDVIKENAALQIESTKLRKNVEPVYLDDDEIQKIISVVNKDNSWYPIRDRAIILTFIYTGLRLSELVNLNIHDIDYKHKQIRVVGKGNKERVIPLHERVLNAIDDYIARGRKKFKKHDDNHILFLSNRGNRIGQSNIEKMINKYIDIANINKRKNISPHKLRHTFATRVYRETKDLKVLQDLLGHENLSTTQIYTHTDHKDRKDAVDKLPNY